MSHYPAKESASEDIRQRSYRCRVSITERPTVFRISAPVQANNGLRNRGKSLAFRDWPSETDGSPNISAGIANFASLSSS